MNDQNQNTVFPECFIYANGMRFFYTLEDKWTNQIKFRLENLTSEERWSFLFELLKSISRDILLDTYEALEFLELYHANKLNSEEEKLLKDTIILAWQENSQASSQLGAFAAYLLYNPILSSEQAYEGFKYVLSICLSEFDEIEAKEFINNFLENQ